MKTSLLIIAVVVLGLLAGCDSANPPVVVNATKTELLFQFTLNHKGKTSQQEILFTPKMVFWRRGKGLILEGLTVHNKEGELLASFDKAAIEEKRKANPVNFEVWVVYENEIELHSEDILEKFRN